MKTLKSLSAILLGLFLSGCFFGGSNTIIRNIEPPPDYLLQDCSPKRPETSTLRGVILIQNEALNQCNDQLKTLRKWKEGLNED